MILDNIFNRDTGGTCCNQHIRPDEELSECDPHVQFNNQVDTAPQSATATHHSCWYDDPNSDISVASPITQTSKSVSSLPLRYLMQSVSASSEMVGSKFRPVTSTYINSSSLPASSTTSLVSPTPSAHLASSTNIPLSGNVAYSAEESIPSHVSEAPNIHRTTTSEQIHMSDMMHLRPRIQREGEFVCGWGAAFINICITFPLNKTMFRQQLHGISGLTAIDQLRRDGLRFLYRGLLPPLLQKSSSLSVMFGMYYKCQDVLRERVPSMNIYINHTIAALGAGTVEAIFTPFERIQALLQTREYHNKFANTLDAFYCLKSYGLREYYRGLTAIILRNGPSNVAFFLGREHIQLYGPQSHSKGEKVALDFISGACLGAVISTCFFPLNVVKIRMQCVLGGPYPGIWSTLKVVMAERNGSLSGLYKGVHLNYMRSFLSWGIINASYEFLMKSFFTHD